MIPDEWEVKKVGEIGKVITGKTPPTAHKEFFYGKYPFIRIPDMGNSVYIKESELSLSEEGAEYMVNLKLQRDSVMVSCLATIGKTGITSKDSFTNQQINSIIPNKNVNSKWLYYYFNRHADYLESLGGGGSVYTNISKSKFEHAKIILPPKDEQDSISNFLYVFDAKIELNQQMNKTLEAIGQSIFKHWFIDFEFPNEQGKPYKSSGGEMVDSDMGKIPKGSWIKKLPEVATVIDCLHTKKPEQMETGNILVQFYNLNEFHSIDISNPYFISDKDYKIWAKNILVSDKDILFTNAGRQAIAKVPYWFRGGIGRNITAVRATEVDMIYLLQYFLSDYGLEQISKNIDEGTIFSSLNVKGIRKLKIITPPKDIIKQYSEIVRKLRLKIENNELQSRNLSQIRDSLSSKLMSGKIRIPVK